MKYIVDIDALKDCLKLLHAPTTVYGKKCVYLENVLDMIDKFPKDEYGKECEQNYSEKGWTRI